MALNDTLTGEICHIKGARPGSARHDRNQPPVERNGYGNLILMCPTHHTVIDDDEEGYPVERLQRIKREHEARSEPVSDAEASRVAQVFVHAVSNISQSGGLSAHTVNATNITVQSASPGSHLTHQRQMQAIENLWNLIHAFSSEFSSVIFVDSILIVEEIEGYFKGSQDIPLMDALLEYRDMHLVIRKIAATGANDASKERPFVSPQLWSIFFVIQEIYGRAALLITNSFKKSRLDDWHSDKIIDNYLRARLPGRSVDELKNLPIGGLRTAIDFLEQQFLSESGFNKPQH